MKIINLKETIKNQKEEKERMDMQRSLEGLAARSSGALALNPSYYQLNQTKETSEENKAESNQ